MTHIAGVPDETSEPVLEVNEVHITNKLDRIEVVKGVSFRLGRGEVLGIVGESGSGKTITLRAVLGILPELFAVTGGSIELFGRDVSTLTAKDWNRLRGSSITAVFQDPGSYLTPSIQVGKQIAEVLRVKKRLTRRQAYRESLRLLEAVRLRDPELVYRQYVHELSGGMLQRVLLASAIALDPKILIADEATTALDVTVQAEVLDLLVDLKHQYGLSLIVVSHDLAVVAQISQRVIVMRNGAVVEHGATADVLSAPQHEYTRLLVSEHNLYGLDRYLERTPAHVS